MTAAMDRTLTAPRPDSPRTSPRRARSRAAAPPPRRPERDRSPHAWRRVVYGLLVGAVTMFGVATLDSFAGAQVPVLGTFAALPGPGSAPAVVEVPAPPSKPGTCLNWTRADAADAAVVDCRQSHLFEQAGSVTLTDQPALPDDQQWRQLVKERCTPIVTKYLGGRFDPDGRYRIGALKPSAAKWAQGDRELRCGLQAASRSGAFYPMKGKVADTDQSAVQPAGTCLAIDGRSVGDPVPCSGPHAVETVGIVDLAPKFTGDFPAVADQDAYLQPTCAKIASDYAGGDQVIADKKLTVYWDNITEDSWKAGSRKVNCNLAALLPDRSGFAPVTGSVKGPVTVGDQPAPPATGTPTPGAPAPTSAAPAPDQPPADGGDVTPSPAPAPAPAPSPPAPAPASPLSGPPPLPLPGN